VEDRQRALLVELAEVESLEAQLFARKMGLRASMDRLWNPPDEWGQEQFGVLELAGTARIGQARASSQLVNGTRLAEQLPGTLAALQTGTMYRETAVLLLELTRNCTAAVVRELEQRLLPTILTANTTDVRRLVLILIPEVEADLDPGLTEQRLKEAHAQRQVWLSDRGSGMTGVTAEIDAVSARRWALDFEELVRAQKVCDDRAGIVRTAAQRRADVFAQLPSRFLALLQAVRKGQTEQLLALALADPDLADDLEALAATLPFETAEPGADPDATPPEPVVDVGLAAVEAAVEDRAWCAAALHDQDPDSQWEAVPLPPEPPPDWARDPDPPPGSPHWTDLSLLELASTVLGLPVRNALVLNVHVPMSTLLQLDQRTASIDQGGALPASLARLLVAEAALRRVFVDPDSGVPIGIDPHLIPAPRPDTASRPAPPASASTRERLAELLTPFELREQAEPRHDPSRRLRELIDLRDQHCTGIGCSQPARRCHHDHETPYPEGTTAAWNLSAKSARCHRAKHAGWTVVRHDQGPLHGHTTWTSPLGHSYRRLGAWTHPSHQPLAHRDAPDEIELAIPLEIDLPAHAA